MANIRYVSAKFITITTSKTNINNRPQLQQNTIKMQLYPLQFNTNKESKTNLII